MISEALNLINEIEESACYKGIYQGLMKRYKYPSDNWKTCDKLISEHGLRLVKAKQKLRELLEKVEK
jgi:hypothetical protein